MKWLCDVLFGMVNGLLALVPSYELPGSVTDLGSGLGSALAGVAGVFPIGTLGLCLAVVLGLRLFMFAFASVVWLWQQIPFTFK